MLLLVVPGRPGDGPHQGARAGSGRPENGSARRSTFRGKGWPPPAQCWGPGGRIGCVQPIEQIALREVRGFSLPGRGILGFAEEILDEGFGVAGAGQLVSA